ncbi:MAG: hypothetical protein SGI87_10340 [Flavobacteriales bacterium]|nr:hypothetical protein [Flavobacteriales bacterium]
MKAYTYILALMMLAMPALSGAQCRAFTKNSCLPMLEDYIQNDNYNSAVLIPGDEAEILLTFYANKQYRLVVCGHPRLGEVQFEVLDANQEMIYSSKNNTSEKKSTFDFKMQTTQQLIVRVRVPENDAAAIKPEGCVSIMVGYKE